MSTDLPELPLPTLDDDGQPACCGEGSWNKGGQPLVLGCRVCPRSATNWRRKRAGDS